MQEREPDTPFRSKLHGRRLNRQPAPPGWCCLNLVEIGKLTANMDVVGAGKPDRF